MAALLAAVTVLTAAQPAPAMAGGALADVPPGMLALYQSAAASCPGLDWSVLAAVGKIESDHGRSGAAGVRSGRNAAGAAGPMQFLAPTWAVYGVDGNGDGVADPYNPADAVPSAAGYLCASGAGRQGGLYQALFAYNQADSYVRAVLAQAVSYATAVPALSLASASTLLTDPRLDLSPQARADLRAGLVDPRLVATIKALLTRHRLSISVLRTGHSTYVAGTSRISNHVYGRAADIAAVDGMPVTASNTAARDVVLILRSMSFPERRPEIGQPWADLVGDGAFTDGDHLDHVHLGFFSATTSTGGP